MENNYKPNTVIHLYENAHSGFYGPDSSATVDLLPKTWTRYTVTDGNWMTDETVNPLINRDIYLANKIDDVDEYFGNLYQEGSHIVIDKETNTISLTPFEYKYIFTNGILNDDYDVYTTLPDRIGGLENRLYLTNSGNSGLSYKFTPGVSAEETVQSGEYNPITGLIGEKRFPFGANVILVTKAEYKMDKNYSDSGEWIDGYTELYDREQGQKVRTEYHGERPPVTAIDEHIFEENMFDPSDTTVYDPIELTGGKNYNTRSAETFNPTGVLFIYDKD